MMEEDNIDDPDRTFIWHRMELIIRKSLSSVGFPGRKEIQFNLSSI